MLLIALDTYGVIGVDLATFRLILDAPFEPLIPPAPTLPDFRILSLVAFGKTTLVVSVQKLGTAVLLINKMN